ncbi:hypothetical protein [Caulobacter vibrioides]|uniref:Uncharacterized protein n=2 Tax=Caulobacter vibrioides TaxID=155892 RepID=Q9A6L5_CAUVC|nr:hypothetical protein [Caulobacter vibrioides]YP_002517532.1 hypothetical protein CCNA_02159 [Caulobacter vibrioides NA1000]AAK24049.1 hypothetical protein CC_2078 [Caulobacter vibrioides CB15]ACL95624.1 hypothetical protein CCNA_02159 [Caulobacter vibrioides NA1000]ATC28949.1 hypothetical protein CA607_11335 [Caulobacter vibrioides]QXZ50462.1 hypothetical protein KZH45_11090 [Caulobacter vibrioides]
MTPFRRTSLPLSRTETLERAMLRLLPLALGLITVVATQPALAASRDSWGKAGTSFLQYRTDAVECAYEAQTKAPVSIPLVDLTYMTDAAQPDGLAQQDATQPNMDVNALVDHAARAQLHMNKTWREVARQLEPALEACLRGRGYRPFRLAKSQIEQLKRLPTGSRARQVYLWNLSLKGAADPRR